MGNGGIVYLWSELGEVEFGRTPETPLSERPLMVTDINIENTMDS